MADLIAEVDAILDPMICRTPEGVGGSQPGRHCAACCMGTGYQVGSQEELDLARLLARVRAALVEAVHRSQQLDTALDVVNRLLAGDWTVEGCDGSSARWRYDDAEITDAERAVLALAERRHRD
jgi:hypothetical protein